MKVAPVLLMLSCATLAACATFLHVSETDQAPESPCGIVVNQRAAYDIKVTAPNYIKVQAPKAPLRGVDQSRVLSVGVTRMPFASGELGLKLTEAQTLKEVTLSSQPGSTKAVDAAKSALAADTDIREALKPTATPIPATPTP